MINMEECSLVVISTVNAWCLQCYQQFLATTTTNKLHQLHCNMCNMCKILPRSVQGAFSLSRMLQREGRAEANPRAKREAHRSH